MFSEFRMLPDSAVCQRPFWDEVMNSQPLIASQQTSRPKILDRLSAYSGAACVLVLPRRQMVGIVTRQDRLQAIAHHAQWANLPLLHVMPTRCHRAAGRAVCR